jgi:DNA-binding transcriptional MerR regulator
MRTSGARTSGVSQSLVDEIGDGFIDGFSGKRAAEIVDISYRQLDYWARTDLIRPSVADAQGSGSRRRYSYRDLIELRLVKTLLDHGIRLESIRAAFDYLRAELGEDIPSARLVIAGKSAVLVRANEDLVDVVNRYSGQGVFNLNLVDLDGVRDEINAAIVELFPGRATVPPKPPVDDSQTARAEAVAATSRAKPTTADR